MSTQYGKYVFVFAKSGRKSTWGLGALWAYDAVCAGLH